MIPRLEYLVFSSFCSHFSRACSLHMLSSALMISQLPHSIELDPGVQLFVDILLVYISSNHIMLLHPSQLFMYPLKH